MSYLNTLKGFGMALAVASCSLAASASEFPVPGKPVRLVVGFAAGGGLDFLARTISTRLGEELGVPVIVENKVGAGGQVAVEYVARSAPDGHMLHIASAGPYTVNRSLRASSFDPAQEMKGVSLLARMPLVLVTTGEGGADSVRALRDQARSGRLSYGSGGAGTLSHVAGEYFNLAASLKVPHVPYKGSAPAAVDVAGGAVSYAFLDPSIQPMIAARKLKIIAVTTAQRSRQFSGVPTMAEAGVPGYEVLNWYGLAAPRGVPASVIERLNRALVKIMHEPGIEQALATGGMESTSSTSVEFDAFLADERVKWARVIHQARITID